MSWPPSTISVRPELPGRRRGSAPGVQQVGLPAVLAEDARDVHDARGLSSWVNGTTAGAVSLPNLAGSCRRAGPSRRSAGRSATPWRGAGCCPGLLDDDLARSRHRQVVERRMPSVPSRSCVTVPPRFGRATSTKSSAQSRVGASAVPVVAKKKRFGSSVSQAPSSDGRTRSRPRGAGRLELGAGLAADVAEILQQEGGLPGRGVRVESKLARTPQRSPPSGRPARRRCRRSASRRRRRRPARASSRRCRSPPSSRPCSGWPRRSPRRTCRARAARRRCPPPRLWRTHAKARPSAPTPRRSVDPVLRALAARASKKAEGSARSAEQSRPMAVVPA
jgi:hypothetical protein